MAGTDLVTEAQVDSLSAAVAVRVNALKNSIGDTATLATTSKVISGAINEVNAKVGQATGSTDLTRTLAATTVTIESNTGADAVIPAADATNAGVMTNAMFTKLSGIATGADVTAAGNVGSVLNAAAAKASLVDADTLPISDSAASGGLKKVTMVNLRNNVIAAIQTGAPALLDTIDELAAALGDDPNAITTINTALSNRLRIDAAQGLSAPQQAQGRFNLGIAISTYDFAAAFNTATA